MKEFKIKIDFTLKTGSALTQSDVQKKVDGFTSSFLKELDPDHNDTIWGITGVSEITDQVVAQRNFDIQSSNPSRQLLPKNCVDGVRFPNGLDCWTETHYEIVRYLIDTEMLNGSMSQRTHEAFGRASLYELARTLTNDFEKIFEAGNAQDNLYEDLEVFLKESEKSFEL